MRVEGHIVDIHRREVVEGSVEFHDGVITAIHHHATTSTQYIMPGFIDAHVHIESSMLTPEQFGDMVIRHGTVGVVADPHEIANVLGVEGVEFMLESATRSPIKTHFAIPSSVPATPFDVSGGVITSDDVARLAASGGFVALAEVMNVPGVLARDEEVMRKLEVAKRYDLVIDGHAPLLTGDDLTRYAECGITTDHECIALEEAREKIERGMKILIREGSAAMNYESLAPLISTNPDDVIFCTDDSHPDETLRSGHINRIVRRAVADGYPLFDVLRAATINAVEHYRLDVGTLRVGERADFITTRDLTNFEVESLFIDGEQRYNRDVPIGREYRGEAINNFHHAPITTEQLRRAVEGEIVVIGLIENEIVTRMDHYTPSAPTENLESDVEGDLVKIVYINRYTNGAPQVAYCRGFGLRRGAIATSIAHDSHNIIAVGCSDREITQAVNEVIAHRGALAVCDAEVCRALPLPVGGIMSDGDCESVAEEYDALQRMIAAMHSPLVAPFMTLSMLSLIVIPEVKIGERGLFSYSSFDWIRD